MVVVTTMCFAHADTFTLISARLLFFPAVAQNSLGSGEFAADVCECSTESYDDTSGLCGETASALSVMSRHKTFPVTLCTALYIP